MSQTVDTNLLVYASNSDAAEHDRARGLIDHLVAGPSVLVLLWPTVISYLRIVTHPSIFPTPLAPAVAMDNIEQVIERPRVRLVGETDRFWTTYRGVADPVSPRGNLVPDAHLVALMREHDVATIWTRDRDFRKFDGITLKDPFDDRYASGFS